MREDHRRLGDRQHIAHGLGRDMGEINQHADIVHLPHDCFTERGKAAVFWRGGPAL